MRRSVLVLVVVAALLAGCSDDGGSDDEGTGTTTTAEPGTTDGADPSAADDPTTTAGPDEPDATTTTTTSPNLAPSDSPLLDLLVAPATFGSGHAPDDTYGDGTFDGDLCEDVTIEPTWDDQAGQALSAGEDSVSQAVLRFPDADVAAAFVQDLVDGVTTCDPNIEPAELADVGDEATRLSVSDEEGSRDRVVVRVGPLVTTVIAVTDGPSPLTDDVVGTIASTLTA